MLFPLNRLLKWTQIFSSITNINTLSKAVFQPQPRIIKPSNNKTSCCYAVNKLSSSSRLFFSLSVFSCLSTVTELITISTTYVTNILLSWEKGSQSAMFRLVWTMMGPEPNKNPSGCLRQLHWHFFPVVHLKETAKRFILGGVSKCVSKMQSAWIMFVTDRPRCWANVEKTKCILGMRVKILLPRKSQFVQSGILSAESQNCNLQNRKLQKAQVKNCKKTQITNCKKHKSQIA